MVAAISGSTMRSGTSTTPRDGEAQGDAVRDREGGDDAHHGQSRRQRQQRKQEQHVVEAAQDVLDAEAEVGTNRACRPALRRSVACDGNAHQAVLLLEHHLPGAARPLNVGDRVMVGAEHGVDAVAKIERLRIGAAHA